MRTSLVVRLVLVALAALLPTESMAFAKRPTGLRGESIQAGALSVQSYADGTYALRSADVPGDVLRADVAVESSAGILRASMYPKHTASVAEVSDEIGTGRLLSVRHTGLPGKPDLMCDFSLYANQPWGQIRVRLTNSTAAPVAVHSIHILESVNGSGVNLNGPDSEDRVLSDSFSEDTPPLRVMDLGEPNDGIHRGFGSQLIYNRKSGISLFLGALSADRLLTVFHLRSTHLPDSHVIGYDVEDTGTGEALHDESSAKEYGSQNVVSLHVKVGVGESLETEKLMFAVGHDYHAQLENYGRAIRVLRKARVSTPTLIGWWSWTAYYYGVTEGTVLTNAAWLAQNLEKSGYRYFQVDEGYQYARGEYATADGKAFPHGMAQVGDQVGRMGLTFGLWVAPFEVSDRSWVYEHHRDWLVRNLQGDPIHIGKIGNFDQLYVLDTTNPGAQEYLRQTYRTLVNQWGARFLKLDFMDAASVEGVRYAPNTTALEALRIGLKVIRNAVGEDVILDKDGSPMLTPVGIVNAGRISQDTGHTFESTHDAAPGIAARYYMNHNFYESDPDAFTVSEQIIPDRGWHGNKQPLTQDEAEASIALSAVSGGMFEIGDDLPALGASTERLALVRNRDLLDMARLGRASTPVDLMSFRHQDEQPSIFLLKEDDRQAILTVFNWTTSPAQHALSIKDLGLNSKATYRATDVLRGTEVALAGGQIDLTQKAHSVRMIKLVDTSRPPADPRFDVESADKVKAGQTVQFRANGTQAETPVLEFHWDFGDGVHAEGAEAAHTFTQPGNYNVIAQAIGLEGRTSRRVLQISVKGFVPTVYDPAIKERYLPPQQ